MLLNIIVTYIKESIITRLQKICRCLAIQMLLCKYKYINIQMFVQAIFKKTSARAIYHMRAKYSLKGLENSKIF